MIKERPILFSGQMVKAILEGRKTQTRRVIKPQPIDNGNNWFKHSQKIPSRGVIATHFWNESVLQDSIKRGNGEHYLSQYCPYGQPGDLLWVRETHYLWGHWVKNGISKTGKQKYKFIADKEKGVMFPDNPPLVICKGKDTEGWYKRPAIFMPRWACRIILEVTAVRAERVQDISEADAMAEGVEKIGDDGVGKLGTKWGMAKTLFAELWDSINGKKYPWASNPFVWVVEFKKVQK